jgi:pimeloyl-ACP methyl ester carboxylesterase
MKLFFQKYPESYSPLSDSRVPVVIIPGLFGSTTNWRSFAKRLAEYVPVLVVDQRNHGQSPHADSHNYFDMAEDLLEFIDSHDLAQVILCGHSMGGKAAMIFSLLYPDRVKRLTVLDIAPVTYQHSHAPYLEKMIELDLDVLPSRSAADRALKDAIPEVSTRMFLLQNLVGSQGAFRWRLNLPILLRDMKKILSFPTSELDGLTNSGDTLFIYGEQSNYLKEMHHNQVLSYFASADFVAISGAGHWLHVEQPNAVLNALLNFLQLGKNND